MILTNFNESYSAVKRRIAVPFGSTRHNFLAVTVTLRDEGVCGQRRRLFEKRKHEYSELAKLGML